MQPSAAVLEASIVALVLGLALRTSPRDGGFVACRPRLLLRAFVAMDVLLPLFTMSALSALRVPASVVLGATLLAISPGASLTAQRQLRAFGQSELLLSSTILGSLLSIVTVPVWLGIASARFLPDAFLSPGAVMRLLAILFVLPLTVALLVRRIAPELMARASGPLIVASNVMLVVVLLFLMPEIASGVRRLGLGAVGAIGATAAGAVMLGHLAGGRNGSERSAFAMMSAARHPGLALLIARFNFDGDLVLPAVVISLLIGSLLTLPYAYLRRRSLASGHSERIEESALAVLSSADPSSLRSSG